MRNGTETLVQAAEGIRDASNRAECPYLAACLYRQDGPRKGLHSGIAAPAVRYHAVMQQNNTN